MYRGGLVVGFGVGVGGISASDNCSNCGGGAGGLEFHIGAMVNPRLAVMFEGWGLARPVDGGGTLTNSMGGGALQFWVNDVFWLKGVLGFGTIRVSYDDGYYYSYGSVSESALGDRRRRRLRDHAVAQLRPRSAAAGRPHGLRLRRGEQPRR